MTADEAGTQKRMTLKQLRLAVMLYGSSARLLRVVKTEDTKRRYIARILKGE